MQGRGAEGRLDKRDEKGKKKEGGLGGKGKGYV